MHFTKQGKSGVPPPLTSPLFKMHIVCIVIQPQHHRIFMTLRPLQEVFSHFLKFILKFIQRQE